MGCCDPAFQTALCIAPGRPFSWTVRPALPHYQYAEIEEYSGIAPLYAVATAHGLAAGWLVSIVDASGQLPDSGPAPALVTDTDTLELDQVGPIPAWTGGFEPYEGGHFLRSLEPLSLAGATAIWSVFRGRETPLLSVAAVLDDATHSVTVALTPLETQALTWAYGRHELRLQPASGPEITLASGTVCVGMAGLQEPEWDLTVTLSGVGAGAEQAVVP